MTNKEENNGGAERIAYEKQRKELNQSLKYASYIQRALLPDKTIIDRYFPENLLIYIPRDIVSGDFYWALRKKNRYYLAVADCTGHGVPGAFMSILGISFLNQITDRHDCTSAAMVLNLMREYVMKALQQTGREHEQKDGIDMAFCLIDTDTNQLQFAGAFNPLYVVRKDSSLTEVGGDKMPIGVAPDEERSFTNHRIQLEKGEMVYLFSDGFVDQFGGPEGKKFKYAPFRKLLQSVSQKPVKEQSDILKTTFLKWKDNYAQLDDVLVFGFRYS